MFSSFSQKADLLIKVCVVAKVIWKEHKESFFNYYKSTQLAFSVIKLSSLIKSIHAYIHWDTWL